MTSKFEMTRGKTIKQIRYNCRRYYEKRFYELVGLQETDIRALKRAIEAVEDEDMEIEALRFSNHLEIEVGEPEYGYIDHEYIKGKITGKILCTAPLCNNLVEVDEEVKITDPQLYYLMRPVNLLKKAIQYNINVVGRIRKNISEGIFTPYFPTLMNYIPVSLKERFSNYMKKILTEKVRNNSRDNLFIVVFYNFCVGRFTNVNVTQIKSIIFHRSKIVEDLSTNLLVVDSNKNLLCNGEIILTSGPHKHINDEATCSILPHFTVKRVQSLIEGIPTKTVEWLNKNEKLLPENFKAITIFQTNFFLVTKKNDSSLQLLKTLRRHIDVGMEEDTSVAFSRFILKRKLSEEDSSSSSGAKRSRIETASSTLYS